jgi:cobalt-precorrin 5A hydrolase
MKIALITLSSEGVLLINRLAEKIAGSVAYLHEKAAPAPFPGMQRFGSIMNLTADIFHSYSGLIYVAPCGVVVRAVAPHIKSKHKDPAVVAVDAAGRYAISLIGGHEGGDRKSVV